MNAIQHHTFIQQQHAIGEHGKPFIDKISITLPYPNEVYANSIKKGGDIDYDEEFKKVIYTAINEKNCYQQTQKKGYKINYRILLETTTAVVFLQVFTKGVAMGSHMARLEFNPKKVEHEGLEELAVFLSMLFFGECDFVWKHGRVSSMDIAIDLHDVTVGQMRFLHKWGTTQQTCAMDGKIETIYLGKGKTQQTKIYDKVAELGISFPVPITRIERRVKSGMMLKNLGELKFPFAHLSMDHEIPVAPKGFENWQWEFYCDAVEKRGPVAASALLPKDLRKIVLNHLKQHHDPVWQPTEFWSHWPAPVKVMQTSFGTK
jgi:hypothetical protein